MGSEALAMKRHIALALGIAGIAALSSTTASAQDTNVYTAPPAPAAPVQTTTTAGPPATVETTTGYSGPNRYMIGSGLVVFGLSYIPAVIVAAQSSQTEDHHLYVPVVGPWLDIANRPACGPGSVGCDTETTAKVLIAVDGVFQGVGALTTVLGFLTPEHHSVTTTASDKPTVTFTPAQIGPTGYGAAAIGSF
jgi:hypothetical protein